MQKRNLSAFLSLAVTVLAGCSAAAPGDSTLENFVLSADDFGANWVQQNEDAGGINFSRERVGDLCDFDREIRNIGARQVGAGQLVRYQSYTDFVEQTAFASVYSLEDGVDSDEILSRLEEELEGCSNSKFKNSTYEGILSSDSEEINVQQISGANGLLPDFGESYIAFDYTRVEKSWVFNTNNDYSDDDQYESRGRVVVIVGEELVLLVTTAGRSFKNYGTAPEINEQNVKVRGLLEGLTR
jgi:hypothetical protein